MVNRICEEEKAKGKLYPETQTKGLPLLGAASTSYRDELFKKNGDTGVQMYNSFGSEAEKAIKKGKLVRLFGSTTLAEL